jgi:hypothetical protein
MSEFSEAEKLNKSHFIKDFDCGNNALNDYLKKYALQNQNKNISNTFVVKKDSIVIGYYTLTFGGVTKNCLPDSLNKHLPNYQIPVMILARFAVELKEQGKGLGKALLKNAILKTLLASEIAGIKAIMVNAKDKKNKIFYKSYGFQESNIDELNLFLSIESLKDLI